MPIQEWIAEHDEKDPFSSFTGPEYQYSPGFMCRLAADATGISWVDFIALPYYDRARIVAFHRSKSSLAWVEQKKSQIKAKRTPK